MNVDVWVAAHGGQYGLDSKHEPGQAYDPDTFVDPNGFIAEVERLEGIYLEQHDKFRWLLDESPVAHIGYSIRIYRLRLTHSEIQELCF